MKPVIWLFVIVTLAYSTAHVGAVVIRDSSVDLSVARQARIDRLLQ